MNRGSFWFGLMAGVLAVALAVGLFSLVQAQGEPPDERGPAARGLTIEGASAVPQAGGSGPMALAFNFQGQVKKNGLPYTGTCDMEFGLYDSFSGGTLLETATDLPEPTAVNKGLFATNLSFATNHFTGDYRYIEIRLRCPAGSGTYETLAPRTVLYPAPYALGLRAGTRVIGPGVMGSGVLYLESITTNGDGLDVKAVTGSYAWAIYGEGSAAGVVGYGTTSTGIGVLAKGNNSVSTPNTALYVYGGGITVSGSVKPAFVLTVPSTASCAKIDSPLANGNPNALIFVTPTAIEPGAIVPYVDVHVHYWTEDGGGWYLCRNSGNLAAGMKFNILIIQTQ